TLSFSVCWGSRVDSLKQLQTTTSLSLISASLLCFFLDFGGWVFIISCFHQWVVFLFIFDSPGLS
ncbi:hypothetical protein GIB67_037803, partial [Kingdonia uniflora]